ncbi:DUF2254 domain-containing protein [Ruania alba]|uniref:Uncharacterized membrane protein n=1 Tax=Ruania alba TaxID=648782 RepID=A0A1H5MXB8_9MICO|nr:DUF2254 domain-containing protein [Ruania alba]SEE94004.1 Uncharacterized membrane protein [Ruania alba]
MAARRTSWTGQRVTPMGVPSIRVASPWARLWQPFWALPLAICLVAVVIGAAMPEVERVFADQLPGVFDGGPEGARSVLSTIASAMISVTGLVFSITMVVLQLASSQFSPRVLGNFLHSRITQMTLGVFVASFIFSLTVLRVVRSATATHEAFVPQVSVGLALLLVGLSVISLIAFIREITTSIQVSQVISDIGDATVRLVEGMRPEPVGEDGAVLGKYSEPDESISWSADPDQARLPVHMGERHGHLVSIDYAALLTIAEDLDVVLVCEITVGEFRAEGQPLATIWGRSVDSSGGDEAMAAVARVRSAFVFGTERSMFQDPAFGVRQLVDIAERALSPGINDPTTAVQVIDELHRILRPLVQQPDARPYITDSDGVLRVVHTPPDVEQMVRLAVTEIMHYGDGSIQVPARLRTMLDDLVAVGRTEHRPALEDLLATLAVEAMPDPDGARTSR